MTKSKILVTRRWPQAVEQRLSDQYDTTLNTTDKPLCVKDLQDALLKYDAILPTVTDNISSDVLNVSNPRTKIIANFGVGFSHIDVQAATKAGLVITNTPDVLSECTADIAITLMLMVARRAGEGERELRAGQWSGWRPTHLIGHKVSGKTLGIIGFGRIGQEMAKRAHFGFGMNILIQNRSQVADEHLKTYNAKQVSTVEELLPQCDFLSLHCPGGAGNRHLLNAERLSLMKQSAFVINTARGEVIDENALANALEQDQIGGAGLDVFDGEPDIHPDLIRAKNLVMLPHLGSATRETREAMGFCVVDNLDDFFTGRRPRDRVN